MENFKIIVFIMIILFIMKTIANKRKLPYPVLLVFAGLIIGFVPQLPILALDPGIVFICILPPLLCDTASRTSWHEFRTSIRPISALTVTLVFFTTVAVAVTAHYLITGFTWPLAFILGAVVSFPQRHSVNFLSFVVIFMTLVVQGLSLPLLIRWLKIKPQDNSASDENELQLYLADSTLHYIDQEISIQLENKLQQQLKVKYEQLILDLTKELHKYKEAKGNDEEITAIHSFSFPIMIKSC